MVEPHRPHARSTPISTVIRPRARLALAGLACVLVCTSIGCSTSSSHPSARPPNIVFVLTDDMRLDDLQYMPTVQRLIGQQGATFDNYIDNVSLCCPARASILAGQYSHNTGVEANGGTNGGFETAFANGMERQT